MELNIIDMITQNKYVLSNKKNEFIVIHYTANPDTSAWANAHYFLSSQGGTANYVVDANEIYRSVEDENGAWHCGDTQMYTHGGATYKGVCHNNNSIGIEMCCHIIDDVWYFDNATVDNTIALTKYLMEKYSIDIDHVIRHFDVTGKICPAPYCDYVGDSEAEAWKNFKARLAQECGIEIDDSTSTSNPTPSVDASKSDYQLALDVIAGKYGNGEERRNALGDKFDTVQDLVNRICAGEDINVSYDTSEDIPSTSKSEYNVALDVIAGKYGNGQDRKDKLTSEGYNYDVIQALVNRICAGEDINISEDSNVTPSIDPDNSPYSKSDIDIAYDVIAGLYGNGEDRRNALGDRYDVIQTIVDKICAGEDLTSSDESNDTPSESTDSTDSTASDVSDSDIDLAYRVIAGEFGNGDERREALGDRYDTVQAIVDRICAGESLRGSVSDDSHSDYIRNLAERAIAGEFGNGEDRRNALGDDYDEVQSLINEMLS